MSETKQNSGTVTAHTPGEWLWITPFDYITAPDGTLIAEVSSRPNPEEKNANARLMRATPELLAACELAFEELGKMGCECDCENLQTRCPVCACKSAIAHATEQLRPGR